MENTKKSNIITCNQFFRNVILLMQCHNFSVFQCLHIVTLCYVYYSLTKQCRVCVTVSMALCILLQHHSVSFLVFPPLDSCALETLTWSLCQSTWLWLNCVIIFIIIHQFASNLQKSDGQSYRQISLWSGLLQLGSTHIPYSWPLFLSMTFSYSKYLI